MADPEFAKEQPEHAKGGLERLSADDAAKYEETVRVMIHRENENVNYRITWLTTIQGFLFAALGIAWDKKEVVPFVRLLCILGIVVSMMIFLQLFWASKAIRRLEQWWEDKQPSQYNGPGVVGHISPKSFRSGRYSKYYDWTDTWTLLALVFLLAWVTVMFMKH